MLDLDCRFRRGGFALDVRVAIGAGATAVCGPSGCGKSTLLALVAGLLRPESGFIRLDGEALADESRFVPPWDRHVGLVFQDGQLFPHLDVQRNLLYGWKRLAPSQRRFELDAVLDLLEIRPLVNRRPTQLSGGERQRVGLRARLPNSRGGVEREHALSNLHGRLVIA
jgi:molybdate transport system ATP-binding protein